MWKWIGRPTSWRRAAPAPGSVGLAQAGHVLDGEEVGPAGLEVLGQADVVGQGVFVAARVEDVAGVADGGLAQPAGVADGLDGQVEVGQVVQGVEDAEDVDAGGGGLLDEGADDVVGVVGVADGAGGAQEHLEEDVGHAPAHLDEALPGRLAQEAHGGVEGGPAPHLQREQAGRWAA